jgi:hypothetical protein
MEIVPTPITHTELFIEKNKHSTIRLRTKYITTHDILIPSHLATVLLYLAKAHIETDNDPCLGINHSLMTAKEIHGQKDIYLFSPYNIGLYIHNIRKLICSIEGFSLGPQDFIVSKKGWGYCIHPDIHVVLYELCEV